MATMKLLFIGIHLKVEGMLRDFDFCFVFRFTK